MELASNLAWALAAVMLLAATYCGVRGGKIRLRMASAIMLAVLCCFILLPVISISDDVLAASQAALPVAGQTWRLASDQASVGVEGAIVDDFLLLLMALLISARKTEEDFPDTDPLAGQLVRSQRLRPPPHAA